MSSAEANATLSLADQLRQLGDARKLVLGDVSYYPNIVQGVLPIIGSSAAVELQRWGADFLAEAFATPALPLREKESLCLLVLETVKAKLEAPSQDEYVLRSVVQAAASIYPLAMKWIINNSYDTPTWERISAIRSRILQLWDTATPSTKVCCIKFAQRVVLAQTAATTVEQKRNGLEVSLSMVPPNHPLLDPRSLEAVATGLLDRMLGVLQDNSSDALIVDATLNALAVLVRTRPATANRILNTVLNFNPFKLANSVMTPKVRMYVKSMEKTTRMLLIHISKRDPQNPMTPRIHQQLERLVRSRAEIFDEAGRKRAQQAAAYGDAKRQRIDGGLVTQPQINPLAPAPNSLAALFTLTDIPGLQAFDATQVPSNLAAKIVVSTLSRVDPQVFEHALNGIRGRYTSLAESQPAALNPNTAPLGVEEDEDDYEPDYYAAEDTEQILNKLDSSPGEEGASRATMPGLALGPFSLPPPPTLTSELTGKIVQGTVTRVFSVVQDLEEPAAKKSKAGINRLAARSHDRDSWITVITRLATRASAGLEDISVKDEDSTVLSTRTPTSLANTIRESLYTYVLQDFRKRIDIAAAWLCEEWYNDALAKRLGGGDAPPHYEKWALRLVDGFVPYLHVQDKVLTRFLGEIPELSAAMLARVKALCRDPSLVPLALTSLLYLVMMKPPVRELALDTVQDIWLEFEDARPMAAKYLSKWRPGFVEANSGPDAAAGGPPAVAATSASVAA